MSKQGSARLGEEEVRTHAAGEARAPRFARDELLRYRQAGAGSLRYGYATNVEETQDKILESNLPYQERVQRDQREAP